jgi:glucokinase
MARQLPPTRVDHDFWERAHRRGRRRHDHVRRLVTPGGDVLSTVQTQTHRDGPGTALEDLLRIIDELMARSVERGLSIGGIGIGLPGIVDSVAGTMKKGIERVTELTELPLAQHIQAKTGLPVFVDNDVNALALGEWRYGHGRGASSLVVLALGTGLGGAIILDGRLVRGRSGFGGEFGHVPVNFNGRPCLCGGRGCLAVYAAGYGIAEEWRRRVAQDDNSVSVDPAGGDLVSANAEEVFQAAAKGDEAACAVVKEACQALGAALGGVINGLNPEVIVVTGGILKSLVHCQGEILDMVAQYALAPARAATRIQLVPGHKSQTVRGGAALVLYEEARHAAAQ